jgi:hypothetical protein
MDIVRRLVWFGIVASAASFAIFFVLGNFVVASAQNGGPVLVRDALMPGVHHLSGMILLPLSCDELTVQTQEVSSATYLLAFQSWQDPSVPCSTTPTPREFDTVVFAPSVGVGFSATLDGTAFPVTVLPDISNEP